MSAAPVVPGDVVRTTWHVWKFIDDPISLMTSMRAKYGPAFVLDLFDGPNFITGEPELVRQIFAAPEEVLDAPNGVAEPLVGAGSIVMSSGDRHRRKRKLLMPPFHGARMRAYGEIVRSAALEGISKLQTGQRADLRDLVHRVSLEVIVRAVFGVRDTSRVAAYREAIDATVDGLPPWLLFISPLRRPMGGVGPWDAYVRRLQHFLSLLREEVAAARAAPAEGREDILSMLLAARDEDGQPMSDDELLDELRALVIAGYETTATTLGWALWATYRNPDILDRLREELELAGDPPADELSKLPYLGAVCDEALRRWPITPVTRRRAVRDMQIGSFEVPAGMFVLPSVGITHFDPDLYPDPFAFKPERFLTRKYSTSEFYPFGGGLRRCAGAALANYELRVALGAIVQAHEFASMRDPEPRAILNGVTMRPKVPLVLRYEGRTRQQGVRAA